MRNKSCNSQDRNDLSHSFLKSETFAISVASSIISDHRIYYSIISTLTLTKS